MSIEAVTSFVRSTPTDLTSAWDFASVLDLSRATVPDSFFGDQQPILRGDQHRLWLRWFLEGLVSPRTIARTATATRLDVFGAVVRRLERLYSEIDLPRRTELAEAITDHLYAEVERVRRHMDRDFATRGTKMALLAASSPPRCYICGFAFSQEAQDAFARVPGRNAVVRPLFVDVLRPRGLVERDIKIEVEHVVPVAQGGSGQANLRLACGWCNRAKSARMSLYEVSSLARTSKGYRLGQQLLFELPNPFWTIRILALRGRCQHLLGCSRTAADAELFIAPKDWSGSPNPTNLHVYCPEHDPIAGDRLQSRDAVALLWRSSES